MRKLQIQGKQAMKGKQVWKYLIGIFAAFWILFAIILFIGDIPFYVISIALTTIAMLSFLIVALAWAYTHDY
jgi:hypothetical protein